MPAIETQPAKRLAPLPWAPAHGATGILPVVGPLLRRHVVFARAGSPRHQEGWGLGARSVRVVLTQLSTRRRAPAGVPATSDVGNTRDGCRASAGRAPGEGQPVLLQRCLAPARAKRRTPWWPPGELRHSHQAGRRDARRWPKPSEDDIRLTPPQGGEPERRRDQRRTRRQAGGAENGPRSAAAERGSSKHRPSVTFGCASAPARLPSATRVATTN
jgi:hypothetical protein